MQFRIKKNSNKKFIVEYKKYTLRPFWKKDTEFVDEGTEVKSLYNWLPTLKACKERVKVLREELKPYKEWVAQYCDHDDQD